MDKTRLLPYVVPPAYVERMEVSPEGLVRHLGHDVYTMLVLDLDGVCRNVLPEDLDCTAQKAYEVAISNLESLVRSQQINLAAYAGPRQLPFVIAQGHWTAAACLLLPRLFEVASAALRSTNLLAAVPSRSSLLVFQNLDERYTGEMRALMEQAEQGERKRVSDSLFAVTPSGIQPFGATEPPPNANDPMFEP